MALPKPIRYVAALTICLFVFFLQVFRSEPTQMNLPENVSAGSKVQAWDHDPQLDRESRHLYNTYNQD